MPVGIRDCDRMTGFDVNGEIGRFDKEKKEFMAKRGYPPAIAIGKGTMDLEVDMDVAPKTFEQDGKKKYVLSLKAPLNSEGKRQSWILHEVVYKQLLGVLKAKGGSGKIKVTRVGEGKATRYGFE